MSAGWIEMALPLEEPLTEVLEAWRRAGMAAALSNRTLDAREQTVRRLQKSRIDAIGATPDELLRWIGSPDLATSSRATYRTLLRGWFSWLQETGRREDNPAEALPRIRQGVEAPRAITYAQLQEVLAALEDPRAVQTRAYVLLSAFLGLRVHEVAKVRGEDVMGELLHVRGKGGKSVTVWMPPNVREIAARMPKRGYWFPGGADGHVHRCSVSHAITRAMRRAEVPATPHALRHFFGTETLRASGGNIRVAQVALRHSNIATTARYTLITDSEVQRAVGGIPGAHVA